MIHRLTINYIRTIDSSEYCDFCRCRKCSPIFGMASSSSDSSNLFLSNLSELNVDLFFFLFLLIAAAWIFAFTKDKFYTYSSLLGYIAAGYELRNWGYLVGIFA